MLSRLILPVALAIGLSGCAGAVATITTDLATAQNDAANAVSLYEIAVGIANAAVIADPALGPTVTKVEGIAGPIVSQLEPLITDASADAATIEALVASLKTQANGLTLATASAVKVTPAP
jgi:hypothetical protein